MSDTQDRPKTPIAMRHVEEREPKTDADRKARIAFLKAKLGLRLPMLVKGSQGHGYRYAALNEILATVEEPLRQAGFQVRFATWSPAAGILGVRCVLTHVEGWWECAEMLIRYASEIGGRMNGVQAAGAATTYLSRYTLQSVLGTTAEVDTDAACPAAESSHPAAQLPDYDDQPPF